MNYTPNPYGNDGEPDEADSPPRDVAVTVLKALVIVLVGLAIGAMLAWGF